MREYAVYWAFRGWDWEAGESTGGGALLAQGFTRLDVAATAAELLAEGARRQHGPGEAVVLDAATGARVGLPAAGGQARPLRELEALRAENGRLRREVANLREVQRLLADGWQEARRELDELGRVVHGPPPGPADRPPF